MESDLRFARVIYHNQDREFGIKNDDRLRHMYIIGKTGMGKTTLLENMVVQDIQNGKGVGIVDPHGEFAEKILDFIPKERINDVIYFNPADTSWPLGFNVLENVADTERHLVAAGLLGVFKKLWPDVWSARMEYILNNTILALLEVPGTTILGINRMLSDKEYRDKIISRVKDPAVKSFWIREFANYPDRFKKEAVAPIQNKVGQFVSVPLLRNIVGQVKSRIDMRKAMDEKKILIMNLSKGKIGEDASKLMGGLLITKLQLAAMSRVDVPEEERNDFYLYVDEFQNFATESFVSVLSEARKYRLGLILAHQYITQMEEKVRNAVFGNIGTEICFRVGAEDAAFLEKEFLPEFSSYNLVSLPRYHIYLRLMIDGVATRPFSALTLPPFEKPQESHREKIIKVSRERYSMPREEIEDKIGRWSGIFETEQSDSQEQQPSSQSQTSPKKRSSSSQKVAKNKEKISNPQKSVSLNELLKNPNSSASSEEKNSSPKKKKKIDPEKIQKDLEEEMGEDKEQ